MFWVLFFSPLSALLLFIIMNSFRLLLLLLFERKKKLLESCVWLLELQFKELSFETKLGVIFVDLHLGNSQEEKTQGDF